MPRTTTLKIADKPAAQSLLGFGGRASFGRQVLESVVALAISVLIFRVYAAEGYLISTGSMAPSLLGYHKRVCCPACQYQFARGIPYHEVASGTAYGQSIVGDLLTEDTDTTCPNCGFDQISIANLPRTEGDQLLVSKQAFLFRNPQRWEVAVFETPEDPDQPYVKRIGGLPGETIELLDGDVYANGKLQRKPLEVQRGTRIVVDDHDHEPVADPNWRSRWVASGEHNGWKRAGTGFECLTLASAEAAPSSLNYRHWIRSSGTHTTRVPLVRWPRGVGTPQPFDLFKYDTSRSELRCIGAWPAEKLTEWTERSTDPAYRAAIVRLFETSHVAPISDQYGYNHSKNAPPAFSVRDLMLELDWTPIEGTGEFTVCMRDGHHEFDCVFDQMEQQVRLTSPGNSQPLQTSTFPKGSLHIEMSVMDRQVIVAVNGQQIGPPLRFSENGPIDKLSGYPVRLAARGLNGRVEHLRLYRDIYYTPKPEDTSRVYQLGADQYFMLGDNSPVSVDSRLWTNPAVPASALIGKPFIVHLPSRPGEIHWGGEVRHVRVPDFSKVRYIR